MKTIRIYTDGGCSNNQESTNVGGWGAVLKYKDTVKTLKGGIKNTTNNIMELTAVLKALEAIKDKTYSIEIFSDSAYVVNCFREGWYHKWRINGWITSTKKPVENLELWQSLIHVVESFPTLQFYKVKGHLVIKDEKELLKWYEKYRGNYPIGLSLDDFKEHLEGNHMADALANEGIDDIKAQ